MFLLRIGQYVLRFVFRILYCGINGSVIIRERGRGRERGRESERKGKEEREGEKERE